MRNIFNKVTQQLYWDWCDVWEDVRFTNYENQRDHITFSIETQAFDHNEWEFEGEAIILIDDRDVEEYKDKYEYIIKVDSNGLIIDMWRAKD